MDKEFNILLYIGYNIFCAVLLFNDRFSLLIKLITFICMQLVNIAIILTLYRSLNYAVSYLKEYLEEDDNTSIDQFLEFIKRGKDDS